MVSFYSSPSAAFIPRRRVDPRPPERLRAHYLAERAIADRIRAARSAEERREIFATMYEQLFAAVPDHPRLTAKASGSQSRQRDIDWSLAQLRPHLFPGCTFLEIGAGDCALATRVAARAGQVHAVDISYQSKQPLPHNVRFHLSDGSSVEVPEASIDVAFSDQVMEHLHPEDARAQLANIHRALKPGGAYVCITPNRAYGPSDISAFFDDEARGFHLKEYTLRELQGLLAEAGFSRTRAYVGARGWFVRCPAFVVRAAETLMLALPPGLRRRLADAKALRAILGLRVAAIK